MDEEFKNSRLPTSFDKLMNRIYIKSKSNTYDSMIQWFTKMSDILL